MRSIALIAALALPCAEAFAKDEIVTDELEKQTLGKEEKKDEKEKQDGWKASAKVGLTGSLSNNRMFVGAEDGTTVQVGGVLGFGASFESGQHRWENSLDLQLGGSKTPQIEKFVKSADVLDIKSTYFYTLESVDWFGGFGRLKGSTQILPTKAVRTEDYTVDRVDELGGPIDQTTVGAQNSIDVSGAFEPLLLRETLGVFANPFQDDAFSFKLKLGGAAQQIIGREGFVISAEDPETNTITLKEIGTTSELGAELGLSSGGIIVKEVLTWKVEADFFQPLYTTSEVELSTIEQLNVELVIGLSLKAAKWLSIDYLFTTKRIPLILNDWQVQNLLVLSAGFDLI